MGEKTSINLRVKLLRKALNETQEVFAERAKASRSTIAAIESNLSTPTTEQLISIASSTNVNRAWLLIGEGEMFGSDVSQTNKSRDNGQYGQLVTDMLNDQLKRAYDEIEFLREIIRKANLGKLEGVSEPALVILTLFLHSSILEEPKNLRQVA